MDASAPHPSDQDLRDYGLGQLDDGPAESVHSHLESCPECRRRVSEVSSDSFLGRLRDARPTTERLVPAVSATDGLSMLESAAPVAAMPPPTGTLPSGLADHPDYEIVRELGRGGMGVVYLAQNRLMGRPEVLKVVGGHLISRPAILERFLREIRSAARLHHPNIVTAYSAMRLGESLVLAMEYVEGLDLARLVKARGPLPVANACNYVYQAAMGLQHAHEHGMVHRDIKPANLILARAGSRAIVKVLDFGLAKVTSEGQRDTGLTREGQMLGTPDYIAPEQIRDAQSADIRADIYSLGCTLYYLLSGGPPFRGDNLWDIYQAHFSMDASPLNLSRPEVPVELAGLVAKMIAKEPGRRFQEPRDVAQALKPFFRPGDAGSAVAKPGVSPASPPATARRPAAMAPEPTQPDRGATPSPVPAGARPAAKESSRLLEGLIDLGEPDPLRDTPLDGPVPAKAPAPIRVGSTVGSMLWDGLRGTSPPRWWAAAGALLLVLIVAGAAAVLRLKTRDGVIVLENLPEQAEVYVDGGRVTVSWPGGGVPAEITVPPGRHGVQVQMEGFTAFGEEVMVDAGGRRGIRVRLERPGAATAAGGESAAANRPAGSRSPATAGGADRGIPDRPTNLPTSGTADRTRFTDLAGRWETKGDELVQSDSTRWNCALMFGDEGWTDYDFTVDAMRIGGRNSFSLFFRNTGRGNGFEYAVAGEGNRTCRVDIDEQGRTESLAETFDFSLEDHRWYTARVHVRGGRFACSLYDCEAGREVGEIRGDAGRHPRGRVGLGSLLSSYLFRNIKVTSPDGNTLWEGPPAAAPAQSAGPTKAAGEEPEKVPGTADSPRNPSRPDIRRIWRGRSSDFMDLGSGDWREINNKVMKQDFNFKVIERNDLYIELRDSSRFGGVRVQLWDDRAMIMHADSDTAWRELQKGRWERRGSAAEAGAAPASSPGEVVSITSRKGFGYVIPSAIKKGETLTLQYVSGRWKGWGRFPTESPDAEKGERGDRCRLVICEAIDQVRSRVLAIVPPGTEGKPFRWAADRDYARIVLRINDDDNDFASNPDADVRYRLRLLPAEDRSPRRSLEGTSGTVGMPERGFAPLSNGKDLTGWYVEGGHAETWGVEPGGVIVARGQGSQTRNYLLTDRQYTDFALRLEFNPETGSGGGLAIRAIPGEQMPMPGGNHIYDHPLFKLIGPFGKEETGTTHWILAAMHVKPDRPSELRPAGSWNLLEVEVRGQAMRASVNGKPVVDTRLDPGAVFPDGTVPGLGRARGHIGLQKHTGTVRFRNIEIRDLSPDAIDATRRGMAGMDGARTAGREGTNGMGGLMGGVGPKRANEPAVEPEGQFVSLFNGKDLSGWESPLARRVNWSVEGDALLGGPGSSRYLFTKREYSRFILRFQFQVDEGTAGAVAFWGQPGDVPLWVFLDRTREAMAALTFRNKVDKGIRVHRLKPDPELRPGGAWNDLEIEVGDESIRVNLNGRDLSRESIRRIISNPSNMVESLKRRSGRIGLGRLWGAGSIRFRNIKLRDLTS